MREDWIECKFGDIITFKNGFAFKSTGYLKSGIPIIRIGDIKENEVLIEDAVCVDENKDLIEYEIEKDDILIAMSGATTGKFGRYNLNKKAYLNQRVGNIRPLSDKYIYKSFLFYLLSQLKREIERSAYGGAQPNISSKKIEELGVSFAPLPEQRAIVKKLESLFSSLDAGVADLKKAQQQLKIYRQAVLKKAFEGGNVVKLTNCCIKAEKVNRRSIDLESPLKYIDIGSIDNKLNKIIGFKEYLWKDAPSRAQQIIKKGDILFSTVRTYLRNIAQVESDIYENEICSSGFTVLRADDKKLLNKYLFHFTLYNGFLDKLGELQTGTSYPAVRDKDVFEQLIPLPSVEEQHQIVKQIESRLSVCDSIEQNIKESLEKAEALRQSILKKAFEGNLLTAQELAECKLAEDYEPASVLLERIKAEQTEIKAKPSKK